MKKILNKVTVTGADDSVNIMDLHHIHAQYPFVEFGILLSRSLMGQHRFPSRDWLETLTKYQPLPGALSGHICGAWVREIFMGDWPVELEFVEEQFSRWQLNTHGIQHQYHLGMLTRDSSQISTTTIKR